MSTSPDEESVLELAKKTLLILQKRLSSVRYRALLAGLLGALRPRRVTIAAAILALLAVYVLSVMAYRALAIGPGQMFEGTKAPGAHDWWRINRDNIEGEFCIKCHSKIVSEVATTRAEGTHPIATCEGCHGAKTRGRGHVAVAAKCADCHPAQASEFLDDAHASFIRDIGGGESSERPSWSCKACHTKVQVDMQVTPIAPLRIILDP